LKNIGVHDYGKVAARIFSKEAFEDDIRNKLGVSYNNSGFGGGDFNLQNAAKENNPRQGNAVTKKNQKGLKGRRTVRITNVD